MCTTAVAVANVARPRKVGGGVDFETVPTAFPPHATVTRAASDAVLRAENLTPRTLHTAPRGDSWLEFACHRSVTGRSRPATSTFRHGKGHWRTLDGSGT